MRQSTLRELLAGVSILPNRLFLEMAMLESIFESFLDLLLTGSYLYSATATATARLFGFNIDEC